ncbi:MAG: gp436 family protein [Terriglobia bacterium]
MAYSTQADLLERITEQELIQLTDDANLGAVDIAKMDAAIAAAAGLLDSYAGARYPLPLVKTAQVKKLAVDLALYELESRRPPVRETTEKRQEAALRLLRDVAVGRAELSDQSSAQGASLLEHKAKDHTDTAKQDRFDDEKLKDF